MKTTFRQLFETAEHLKYQIKLQKNKTRKLSKEEFDEYYKMGQDTVYLSPTSDADIVIRYSDAENVEAVYNSGVIHLSKKINFINIKSGTRIVLISGKREKNGIFCIANTNIQPV